MRLATPEQMRAIDRAAGEFGLEPELLMEAAGTLAAEHLARHPGAFAILCGPGHNGADGLVVARHLVARGRRVRVSLFGHATSEIYARQLARLAAVGVRPAPFAPAAADVIVDALFGVGYSHALDGEIAAAVAHANTAPARRIALDLPSGLDGATGVAHAAFRAHETLTFGCAKPGFYTNDGPSCAGEVTVLPIGFPEPAVERVANTHELYLASDVHVPAPAPGANKTHGGHALILGGGPGTWGAGALASEAAFRAGAGYVTWAAHDLPPDALRRTPEVMTARGDDDRAWARATALAIGPGLGAGEATRDAITRALKFKGPVVLDADAITACATYDLCPLPPHWIITPHAGELARLIDLDADAIQRDRDRAVTRAIARAGCVVLLKGFRTWVGEGTRRRVISTGNAALAKAGTGDVLTGLIAGLLARGLAPFDAAAGAAYLHGRVADEWIETKDASSMRASDLLDALPGVIKRVSAC